MGGFSVFHRQSKFMAPSSAGIIPLFLQLGRTLRLK